MFPRYKCGQRAIDKTKIDFFNKNSLTLNDLKLFKQKNILTFHYTGNFLLEKILKKIELLIKFGFTSFFTGNSQNYENQNVENQKELRKPCKPSQRRKDDQNVEKQIFRTLKSELSQRRKELITTTNITTTKRTSKV